MRLGRHTVVVSWLFACGPKAVAMVPETTAAEPSEAAREPEKIRLAVLRAESDAFPRVADAINAATAEVRIEGVDETVRAPVSLEVVQLSIECVEATAACLQAAGASLSAQRMLFARIGSGARTRPRRSVKVSVTLFDVSAGAEIHRAEWEYASADAAAAGSPMLVASLLNRVVRP
jgi:hypothetical protein